MSVALSGGFDDRVEGMSAPCTGHVGAGRMGAVYRATDGRLNRIVVGSWK
jgi:hypothetical protein